MSETAEIDDADRFAGGATLGLFAGVAALFAGFATAPASSGVWYGFGVVVAASAIALVVLGAVAYAGD